MAKRKNGSEVKPAAPEMGVAQEIDEASLSLLEDPGVRIEHDAIVEMLLKHGAKAGRSAQVVKLPRKMVREYLALAPKEFAITNRRGEKTMMSATSAPTIWSCPGLNLNHAGEYRPFTTRDMADMSRLLDQLDNVNVIFAMALDDVPPPARDAVGLAIMAESSSKHLRPLSFSPEGADVMVEMRKVVGEYPWFSVGFTAHGPLRWTKLALEIYARTAGHGIPATVNGEPMAGVSGPVTLAGSLAVGNAEILAGIVINEILEPGRPVIHNLGLAHTFDMRTAIAVTGGPENALYAKYAALMGRYYGLPSASWVSTESMCTDSQTALEKMCGWLTHMQCGVSAIWGLGQLESEISISPAQAVIDNEMISFAKRFLRDVTVTKETLALDVTRTVGIAGSFLDQMHTFENFRTEFFMPQVLFRERRDTWNERGCRRMEERAEEMATEMMKKEVDNALTEGQIRDLRKLADTFVARVKA